MARGNGHRLAVGAADVEVALNEEQLRILLVGAEAKVESQGLYVLPGKVNYLVGRDPKSWRRDIPTYGRVRYQGVYPGVDVVWYGKQGRLEHDLEIQPGAPMPTALPCDSRALENWRWIRTETSGLRWRVGHSL
jgi:hypothetical protein